MSGSATYSGEFHDINIVARSTHSASSNVTNATRAVVRNVRRIRLITLYPVMLNYDARTLGPKFDVPF